MRGSLVQSSFTTGEISPKLYARRDIRQYQSACQILENMLVFQQGGVSRRPGFRYIATAKGTGPTRLIRFRFSLTESYIIEAGNNYFRFFTNQEQLMTGGTPYEIATPYGSDIVFSIKFTQSKDVLFLTAPGVRPKELRRLGPTNWELRDYEFMDGPYLDQNTDPNKELVRPITGKGLGNVTAVGFAPFVPQDVGRHLRFGPDTNQSWGVITAYVSSTVVTVDFKTVGSNGGHEGFRFGAWGDNIGWPTALTFFEERLWFSGLSNSGAVMWFSRSSDFNNFAPTLVNGTVVDDSGGSYTIAANDFTEIYWMIAARVLIDLSDSSEFSVGASSLTESITPSNIRVVRETSHGAANIQPALIDKDLLFWQRGSRTLRALSYDYTTDGFISSNATILSEHISKSGIVDAAFQQEPFSIYWCVRNDGELAALTWNKEQEIAAWQRHITQGKFKAVEVIPGAEFDELWVVVERVLGGNTVQTIELFDPNFCGCTSLNLVGENKAEFLDCNWVYNGEANTAFAIPHFANQEVSVLADGALIENKIVSGNGTLTLDRPASKVAVGLGYTHRFRSVDYELGQNEGTSFSKVGRIQRVGIQFDSTLGVQFGPSFDKLETLKQRKPQDPMDQAPPFFTGIVVVNFPADYDVERTICVQGTQPYPCSILAISPWLVVNQ